MSGSPRAGEWWRGMESGRVFQLLAERRVAILGRPERGWDVRLASGVETWISAWQLTWCRPTDAPKRVLEHLGTDAAHPDQARSNPKNAGRVV